METRMMATTCSERPLLMIAVPAGNTNQTAAADLPNVTCKIAGTLSERMAAFRLVYNNYVQAGLAKPNEYRLRVTEYHLLSSTTMFIAVCRGEVIGTVTLIGDGKLGVPMDITNPEEIQPLRDRGFSFGEVSCLAFHGLKMKSFLPVFVKITRLMAQYARHSGMDGFVCAAVPAHVRFYTRYLGFQKIGEEKPYQTVCDTKGIACLLDFAQVDRERPVCYEQYFGQPIAADELAPRPIPEAEKALLAPVSRLTGNGLTAFCPDSELASI